MPDGIENMGDFSGLGACTQILKMNIECMFKKFQKNHGFKHSSHPANESPVSITVRFVPLYDSDLEYTQHTHEHFEQVTACKFEQH